MAISMRKARTLCTKAELELIKASSPGQIKSLSSTRLRQKLERARNLRDKFKDLSRKQAGEARGKRKPTGTKAAKGNDRTVEKREIFEEVISRFNAALSKAEAADKKTEQAKSKKATAKKATSKKTMARKSSTKKAKSSKAGSKQSSAPAAKAGGDGLILSRPSPGVHGRAGLSNASLSGGGSASSLFGLGSSAANQQSRETRRQQASKSSRADRVESQFARTAQEKIQGHVSASTRRSQAKRDSK